MATVPIYTLGYEKRSFDEYLALLKEAEIDVVIDVRETPWSRKPGFTKARMTALLGQAGIKYVHAGFAGNPRALRKTATDHADALAKYREHFTASPDVLDELEALVTLHQAAGKRVALTCFERHPDDCHRAVLADAWVARRRGRKAIHLAPDGCARLVGEADSSLRSE